MEETPHLPFSELPRSQRREIAAWAGGLPLVGLLLSPLLLAVVPLVVGLTVSAALRARVRVVPLVPGLLAALAFVMVWMPLVVAGADSDQDELRVSADAAIWTTAAATIVVILLARPARSCAAAAWTAGRGRVAGALLGTCGCVAVCCGVLAWAMLRVAF